MEEDCQKYANMDINNLITKTGLFSFYVTSTIMSLYLMSAVSYLAGAIAFQGTNDSMSRELLLKMDLPFETSESPNYELVVTTQFIIHISAALAFGTFTALLFMMASINFMFLLSSCRYIFCSKCKSWKNIYFLIRSPY